MLDSTQALGLAGSRCTILPGSPFCARGEEKTPVAEGMGLAVVVSESNTGDFVVAEMKTVFDCGNSHVGVDQVVWRDCTFLVV